MIPKIELTLFIVACSIQIENSNQFMFQIFIKQSKYFDGSGLELPQPIYRRSMWQAEGNSANERGSEWA